MPSLTVTPSLATLHTALSNIASLPRATLDTSVFQAMIADLQTNGTRLGMTTADVNSSAGAMQTIIDLCNKLNSVTQFIKSCDSAIPAAISSSAADQVYVDDLLRRIATLETKVASTATAVVWPMANLVRAMGSMGQLTASSASWRSVISPRGVIANRLFTDVFKEV